MLTMTGKLRAATILGGGTNKKTGEVIPKRSVLQIEGLDNRGLVQLYTLTVPALEPWEGLVDQAITLPVRAWAKDGTVGFVYEAAA